MSEAQLEWSYRHSLCLDSEPKMVRLPIQLIYQSEVRSENTKLTYNDIYEHYEHLGQLLQGELMQMLSLSVETRHWQEERVHSTQMH